MIPRVFVLLLLVTNVAVGLWWWLRTPPEVPLPPATEPGVPVLRLLSEVDSHRLDTLAADPGAPAVEGAQCLEIGPFPSRADLRRAFTALTPAVSRLQYREARTRDESGYWVFLPATASRQEALAAARELAARGLRDYYVVTAGENENTVSLGLFRQRGNAEQRVAEVRAMGYQAQMAPRVEEGSEYYIAFAVTPESDWRARLGGYADVPTRPIACE